MADRVTADAFIAKLLGSREDRVNFYELFMVPTKPYVPREPIITIKRPGLEELTVQGPEPDISEEYYMFLTRVEEVMASLRLDHKLVRGKPAENPFEEPIRKANRDAFVEADQLLFFIASKGYLARAMGMLKGLKAEIDFNEGT